MDSRQIAPITVQNPKDTDQSIDRDGNCVCCGESMDYTGCCTKCARHNCSMRVDRECEWSGETDPLDLAHGHRRVPPLSNQ